MKTFRDTIEELGPFVRRISKKKADKAVIDMSRNLACALWETNINIQKYINDYNADMIFNPGCLRSSQDDIFSSVSPEYIDFCKVLFTLRPIGLGTPNAMVGEGEFMSLFSSPRVGISKKKGEGDLTVDDETVELKGDELRIMCSVTGKTVQTHAAKISKKFGVLPNKATKNRTAFEPWDSGVSKKLGKRDHWIAQFNKLGVEDSCKYLSEVCNSFMKANPGDFSCCFNLAGSFDVAKFQRVILKGLFVLMDKKWDYFTVIDNGRITSLSKDEKQFSNMVDSGKIAVSGCYFRSFQDTGVGLYVKVV